jgi:hypothetical protein
LPSSSSSGGTGGCPCPIPNTIHATITGANCDCAGATIALTFNGSDWTGSGSLGTGACARTIGLRFTCFPTPVCPGTLCQFAKLIVTGIDDCLVDPATANPACAGNDCTCDPLFWRVQLAFIVGGCGCAPDLTTGILITITP